MIKYPDDTMTEEKIGWRFWEQSPVRKQNFCFTQRGYMATVPVGAKEGDRVRVLLG
jgi:hypothetical protein